jgi:hypothetical protein
VSSKYEGGLVIVQREDEGDNTCVEWRKVFRNGRGKGPSCIRQSFDSLVEVGRQEQYLGSLREGLGVESMIGDRRSKD